MTWQTFHRRDEVLRAVVAELDRRLDGRLPMDVDGVAQTFRDEPTLLAALQLRWHTRLSGHVERALADRPADSEDAVVAAWHATAAELPGVRLVLDHHRDAPVDTPTAVMLARALAKEHQMLAVMAGHGAVLSRPDEATVRVGRAIEARARQTYHPPAPRADHHHVRLLDRIRAVLAA